MLISTGDKAGVKTYQDLVNVTIGRFGTYFLIIAQFLYPFISKYNFISVCFCFSDGFYLNCILNKGLISYNIIIGDTITKVTMRLFKGKF